MQNCVICGGKRWLAKIDHETGLQVAHPTEGLAWECFRCEHIQYEVQGFLPTILRNRANVLYVDIETSKSIYYSYGRNVKSKWLSGDDLLQEYFIVSWVASYVGKDKYFGACVTGEEALQGTDKNILQPLYDLMSSADIIAGHNVDGFDIKRINTRFLLNGISPVMTADGRKKKTIDTLKIARSVFAFEDNRLDWLCKRFGINGKDDISADDWRAVMKGSQETLDKIYKYNRGDVENGKALYNILAPYANKPAGWGVTSQSVDIENMKEVLAVLEELGVV